MTCWKCAAQLRDGTRFCTNCGADQQQAGAAPGPRQPSGPQQSWQQPQGPQQSWQPAPPPGPSRGPSGADDSILKVAAAIFAIIYGVVAVRGLISTLSTLFRSLMGTALVIWLPVSLVTVALNVFMCLVLVMFALKRTPENSDGLLVLLGCGCLGIMLVHFVRMVFRILTYRYDLLTYLRDFALTSLGAVFVLVVIYLILRFVLGEFPLAGKSGDALLQEVRVTLDALGRTAGEAAQGAKSSWDANQQARRQAQQQAQWQSQQQAQWQGQQGYYGQPAPPPGGYAAARLKTNRSLLAYILLTIFTCGIYSWYFIYALARDVNIACAGDGRQTAGLLKLLVLTFLTCGIYYWVWCYSLGNRLADNAPRYGQHFQENGTTVLLWMLVGALLCGIGPFIALHILIKNTNIICGAYNYQHGM